MNLLPQTASIGKYLLICFCIAIVFRFLIAPIKYLFVSKNTIAKGEVQPVLIIFSLVELVLLLGLLSNMSVLYSTDKSWIIRVIFHFISIVVIGADLTKHDRKMENNSTVSFVGISIVFFIILLYWDWLRESRLFGFLFDLIS